MWRSASQGVALLLQVFLLLAKICVETSFLLSYVWFVCFFFFDLYLLSFLIPDTTERDNTDSNLRQIFSKFILLLFSVSPVTPWCYLQVISPDQGMALLRIPQTTLSPCYSQKLKIFWFLGYEKSMQKPMYFHSWYGYLITEYESHRCPLFPRQAGTLCCWGVKWCGISLQYHLWGEIWNTGLISNPVHQSQVYSNKC